MQPMESMQPAAPKQKKSLKLLVTIGIVIVAAAAIWVGALVYNNAKDAEDLAAKQTGDGPTVTITDDGFTPSTIKIKAGQEVTWLNQSRRAHRLMADEQVLPGFDSVDALAQDDSYTFTFDTEGTFLYYDPDAATQFNGQVVVEP